MPSNIINEVFQAIQSDDCNEERESERLLSFYDSKNEAEKEAIDSAITYLCGWRLSTIREGGHK